MLTRRNVLRVPLAACGSSLWGCAPEDNAMQSRIEAVIKAWDAIPDHRTGTDGDKFTADWLASEIAAAGLEPEVDWFPFQRRQLHECRISVGSQSADGVPLFDGAYTGPRGWQAPLRPLADATDIGLTRFTASGRSPATQALQAARQSQRHSAIVAIADAAESQSGVALLNADAYTQPYGPPVLQVGAEHGPWLDAAARERATAQFVAHVTLQDVQAGNVQTSILGRDQTLEPLVIMTPRSAWWTCTSERAGGIAVWLECMRHFSADLPPRTVIFTANTGHELGHVGLDHYLQREPTLIKNAHAWIHLGANFAARDSQVLYQASTQALLAMSLDEFIKVDERPARTTPFGSRPLGEARNIYDGGGEYVSILGDNRWFHHPDDRWPASVDLERTTRLTQAMLAIARNLAGV